MVISNSYFLYLINLGLIPWHTRVAAFGVHTAVTDSALPMDLWAGNTTYPWPAVPVSLELVGGANDTASGTGARRVRVTGLDGSWNPMEEDVITNGAAAVPLTKQFFRINLARVTSAGSLRKNDAPIVIQLAGGGLAQCVIPARKSMSRQSMYSVRAGWSLIIVSIEAALLAGSGTSTRYAEVDTWFSDTNVERLPRPIVCRDGPPTGISPKMGIVVPEKTDFAAQCTSLSVSQETSVEFAFEGFLRRNEPM